MNTRDDTRRHLLDTGSRLIAEKGFTGLGLSELLRVAGVPRGSFYHYFTSKERFGQAVLEDYFARYLAGIDARLSADAPAGCGRDRLLAYWRHWQQAQCADGSDGKCLVVKLSAEVADLSDAMRLALRDGTERVIGGIAALIAAGVADRSLPPLDPESTARTLYPLWLGASLLAKLHRDGRALADAMRVTERLLDA